MYLDSVWVVVDKSNGKIYAGHKSQNAYTTKGRAIARLKACHKDKWSDYYDVAELKLPKGGD